MDDGSSDESLHIAERYGAKHPDTIRVLTHPQQVNRGISATANLAFRQASGEYWTGLPSDDMIHPDKVERQVAYLQTRPEVGFVYGHSEIIDAAGRALPGMLGSDISSDPDPLGKLILGNAIPGLTVLARRECLEESGLHDGSVVYSDWHLWIRLLARFRVGFLNRVLARSRFHSYNTGTAVDPIVHLTRKIEVMKALQGLDSIGGAFAEVDFRMRYEGLMRANISRYLLALAYLHAKSGKRRLAQWCFSESIRNLPLQSFTRLSELKTVLSQLLVPGLHTLVRHLLTGASPT